MLVTAVYIRENSRYKWELVGTAPYYTTEYPDPVKVALVEKAEAIAKDRWWERRIATVQPIEESAARLLDGIRTMPASIRRER